jgi:hypothetical protein
MKGNASAVFAALILIVILVVAGPILTIYSINHLFNLGWVVDLPTWLSVFWIQMLLIGSAVRSKNNG